MYTPIYDFLKKYVDSHTMRGHMPGHHGKNITDNDDLSAMYRLDITEINGADSLFEADGIIQESENNTAKLYGSDACLFSAGGSTACIQAMLGAMKLENRRVIAIRNVHRAFLNACALLDLDVEWIMPDYTSGILSGVINPDDVEAALAKFPHSCLYVTSPDYTGRIADIASLAALCHKYDSLLIVDNAHGAHLRFLPRNLHPISLGADMCCDSAHKMLPALTGAAMLHVKDKKYKPILKQTMSIFTSTSPSYLIMMSLDLCNKYINERIRRDIAANLIHIHNFRVNFVERLIFAESEPFHITIKAAESGYNGNELAEMLRRNGAECEYSDRDTVILLMSPANKAEDYKKLTNALENALDSLSKADLKPVYIPPVLPEKAMSIRNAAFSPCEEIPVDKAEGRICAAVKVPCPPAVPIAASGEIIDRNCIKIFKSYSISSVIVVK